MKTIGERVANEARQNTANGCKLTDKYWGSVLTYDRGYFVDSWKQGFGGMKRYKRVRVSAKALKACTTTEELAALLKPECDLAPGDPMHYTPRNVQRVALSLPAKLC